MFRDVEDAGSSSEADSGAPGAGCAESGAVGRSSGEDSRSPAAAAG